MTLMIAYLLLYLIGAPWPLWVLTALIWGWHLLWQLALAEAAST